MTFVFQGAFDGLVGESPYIGKGRFKQHQRPSLQPPTQQEGLTQMDIDRDMMEKMHDALDRELAEKQAAIDKGQGQHQGQLISRGHYEYQMTFSNQCHSDG